MLKTKERPASADQFAATAPKAARKSKDTTGSERSHTAAGLSTVRSATRMFRQSEDSPSPSRKNRRGSPDRSTSRPPNGSETPVQHGLSTSQILGAPGNGTNIVIAGRGTEVHFSLSFLSKCCFPAVSVTAICVLRCPMIWDACLYSILTFSVDCINSLLSFFFLVIRRRPISPRPRAPLCPSPRHPPSCRCASRLPCPRTSPPSSRRSTCSCLIPTMTTDRTASPRYCVAQWWPPARTRRRKARRGRKWHSSTSGRWIVRDHCLPRFSILWLPTTRNSRYHPAVIAVINCAVVEYPFGLCTICCQLIIVPS